MAENVQPPNSPTKIDLVKAARTRNSSQTPMMSDRIYNSGDIEGRTQLISPPPEETLHFRRTSRSMPFTPSLLASNTVPKRKRNAPSEPPPILETTPNPKPRKQSKHRPILNDSPTRPSPSKLSQAHLTKSPHRNNPEADYFPPIPSSVSRRATVSARARRSTPIPAYEPPSEVFTPPRTVVLAPSISKSSKRKSVNKGATVPLKVVIKKELPHIDLSLPMPPPSPSDDPLLLSSSVAVPTSTPRNGGTMVSEALPPSSSPVDDSMDAMGQPFDWTEPEGSTDFSMMHVDENDADVQPLNLFNLNLPPSSGGWSDSDDDINVGGEGVEEGEGEYTGKWKTVRVRTKLDPPSSATRVRMEEWGRPITPFPMRVHPLDFLQEVEEAEIQEVERENDGDEASEVEEEREVREMSIQLDSEVQDLEASVELSEDEPPPTDSKSGPFDFDTTFGNSPIPENQESVSEELSTRGEVSPPQGEATVLVAANDVSKMCSEFEVINRAITPRIEDEEEEREVREMSVQEDEEHIHHFSPDRKAVSIATINEGEEILTTAVAPEARGVMQGRDGVMMQTIEERPVVGDEVIVREGESMEAIEEDSSDAEDESDIDLGVVKISSADPRAAARAAAILKQYDYDCFTKIMMKQRKRYSEGGRRPRGSVVEGGIVKSGKERRRTMGMGVVGDKVYIPGSPATTLPALLREAEAEVEAGVGISAGTPEKGYVGEVKERNPFVTPGPARYSGLRVEAKEWDGGEREWTKEEWKLLDACFTDERLEIGDLRELGTELAPVDLVRPEAVVERFVQMIGGKEAAEVFGHAWNMDNLLQRVKALQNKQRSGNVAPPTTPYTPSPAMRDVFGYSRRISSMEVPDFTPLGKRMPPPGRITRPVLPPPMLENAPFRDMPADTDSIRPPKKLPMPLLAPRYSHLLEEAVAVSQLGTEVDTSATEANLRGRGAVEEVIIDVPAMPAQEEGLTDTTPEPSQPLPPVPATIGKRVKGFLFSYLPTLAKTAPPGARKKGHQLSRQPGLPLPPLDLLDKPRGPIATPVRPPPPKPKHPKELVQLHPAPPPPKPTMIPRVTKPQRLVDLQPVGIPEPVTVPVPRPRRSSGSSVRDLVKGFEALEEQNASEMERSKKMELRRMKSIGEWRKGAPGRVEGKPTWRP